MGKVEKIKRDEKTDLILCPICDTPIFESVGDYDYCPTCGWFNANGWNYDPDDTDIINGELSVNIGRAMWQVAGKIIKTNGYGERTTFIGFGKPRIDVAEEEYQKIMVKVNELLSKSKQK